MSATVFPRASHERLAERFEEDVSEEHLEKLLNDLSEAVDRIACVAHSVKGSRKALTTVDDDDGMGKLQEQRAAGNFPWAAERRSDLPNVSFEAVGRLTVFEHDAELLFNELRKEIDTIGSNLGGLYWSSRHADDATGGDDA